MSFYVYILASKRNGTLYIGMTDDLVKRVWMHKTEVLPGFTREYAGLVRGTRVEGIRVRARASTQEMESHLEA